MRQSGRTLSAPQAMSCIQCSLRQHPFHTLLYNALTAGMLRNGVGVHRQHDEPPQIRGLLSLAEEAQSIRKRCREWHPIAGSGCFFVPTPLQIHGERFRSQRGTAVLLRGRRCRLRRCVSTLRCSSPQVIFAAQAVQDAVEEFLHLRRGHIAGIGCRNSPAQS